MAGSSNRAANNGETPAKSRQEISGHSSSTNSAVDDQRLRSYRLAAFVNGPDSAPRASTASARQIQSAHETRIAAELDAIARRLR
ncbi:hypothetical protein F5X99DRAFT_405372 [Biscogniauxia marginata]|nr:hypothetical protein F5X99DRAFT_405372 [Biscogniauxia marginata]